MDDFWTVQDADLTSKKNKQRMKKKQMWGDNKKNLNK
jgi:hypothetical protein